MPTCTQSKKLTKRVVKEAKPAPEGSYFIRDTELKGFALRVFAGGSKSFIADSTVRGSRKRRKVTVGKHPHDTVLAARKAAGEALRLMAQGVDPIERNTAERVQKAQHEAHQKLAQTTLREVLEKHLERGLAEESRYRADFDREFKTWLDLPVREITRQQCQEWWKGKNSMPGTGATADRIRREMVAVLNTAMKMMVTDSEEPLLERNPMGLAVEKKKAGVVDRTHLDANRHDDFPYALMSWVDTVAKIPNTVARDFFLLILNTGMRVTEALGLRWENVDFGAENFTLENTKNKRKHTIPLSVGMRLMLAARREPTGLIFPIENPRYWTEWVREQADLTYKNNKIFKVKWLRTTFGHLMNNRLGVALHDVGRMLNHTETNSVTSKHYVHTDLERFRDKYNELTEMIFGQSAFIDDDKDARFEDAWSF
jgi:integrase